MINTELALNMLVEFSTKQILETANPETFWEAREMTNYSLRHKLGIMFILLPV